MPEIFQDQAPRAWEAKSEILPRYRPHGKSARACIDWPITEKAAEGCGGEAAPCSVEEKMRAAIYARYSTDMQREQSIEDQFRVAVRIAERHGFTVVAKFADQAISGGTTQRPEYQKMLTAAFRSAALNAVSMMSNFIVEALGNDTPALYAYSGAPFAIVRA